MRSLTDIDELRAHVPEVDAELLARYLRAVRAICEGDETAGPVALTPPSERFHWVTAPRSDVIQSSPIHEGVCFDPERELDALFQDVRASFVMNKKAKMADVRIQNTEFRQKTMHSEF